MTPGDFRTCCGDSHPTTRTRHVERLGLVVAIHILRLEPCMLSSISVMLHGLYYFTCAVGWGDRKKSFSMYSCPIQVLPRKSVLSYLHPALFGSRSSAGGDHASHLPTLFGALPRWDDVQAPDSHSAIYKVFFQGLQCMLGRPGPRQFGRGTDDHVVGAFAFCTSLHCVCLGAAICSL